MGKKQLIVIKVALNEKYPALSKDSLADLFTYLIENTDAGVSRDISGNTEITVDSGNIECVAWVYRELNKHSKFVIVVDTSVVCVDA